MLAADSNGNVSVNESAMKSELKSKLSDMMTNIEQHLQQIHSKVKRSAKETIQYVEKDIASNHGSVSFETTSNEANQELAFNSKAYIYIYSFGLQIVTVYIYFVCHVIFSCP